MYLKIRNHLMDEVSSFQVLKVLATHYAYSHVSCSLIQTKHNTLISLWLSKSHFLN